MISILVLVVIYNKKLNTSVLSVLNSNCSENSKIDLLVVDNSDDSSFKSENKSYCENNGAFYHDMHGNKGLSKAYNYAVSIIDSYDMLVIFDDDTPIPSDYFSTLLGDISQYQDVDIFAPVVYGQDGIIYSPNEFNFLRNKFISNPSDHIDETKFNAISSGLAIRKRVFNNNYRFNEALFVDQVDQYFFCEQRKLNRKFRKMQTIIHQQFYQRDSKIDKNNARKRLLLRIRDIFVHAKLMGGGKYYVLAFIKTFGLSLQISLKSKSIVTFFKTIQCIFKSMIFVIR